MNKRKEIYISVGFFMLVILTGAFANPPAIILGANGYAEQFVEDHLSKSFQYGESPSYIDITYNGSFLSIPSTSDDALYQGIGISLRSDPSIRFGLSGELEAGYEYRPEKLLYESDGSSSGERRQDLILTGTGVFDGLAGYFLSWHFESQLALRLSNENLFQPAGSFIENSEDAFDISMDTGVHWSPHQSISLQIAANGGYMWYLQRPVILADGNSIDEKLVAFRMGGKVDFSWTPNHVVYLKIGADTNYIYYNSSTPSSWTIGIRGGIDFSF